MTPNTMPDRTQRQARSRREFAKVAAVALATIGAGGAVLHGALEPRGDDVRIAEARGSGGSGGSGHHHRRRKRRRRRRRGGSGGSGSGGSGSGGSGSGGSGSGGSGSGSGGSGDDD